MQADIIHRAENFHFAAIIIITLIWTTGALILMSDDLRKLWLKYTELMNDRLVKIRAQSQESSISRDIRFMLISATGKKMSSRIFVGISAMIFTINIIITIRIVTLEASILFSGLTAIMPYVILKLVVARKRNRSSNEAETLLTNLIIQYRINRFNIEEALEAIIQKDTQLQGMKPLIYSLLIKLRSTRNRTEIREATEIFAYGIGTKWAVMLAHNIYTAAINNINITMSLEDLMVQLREIRDYTEEKKRLNLETKRMLWLIPISLVGTYYMAINYCNIPVARLIDNQFGTKEGVIFFIAVMLMSGLCWMLVGITQGNRFDF